MDKDILKQYIDACALIEETKAEIRKLKKQKKRIEHDIVKGSSQEFPYTAKTFHVEGMACSVIEESQSVDEQEKILKCRIADAESIKQQVERWINTIPQRMQRIIRYKFFDEMTWVQVASRIGRKATPDKIRMEFNSFMENEK